MKAKKIHNLVTIRDLSEITDTSQQNISNTYVNNINGKDKRKMLKALVYGTFMMKEKITPKEIELARELIITIREKNARKNSK